MKFSFEVPCVFVNAPDYVHVKSQMSCSFSLLEKMRLIFPTGFHSHKSLSTRIRNAEALTVAENCKKS